MAETAGKDDIMSEKMFREAEKAKIVNTNSHVVIRRFADDELAHILTAPTGKMFYAYMPHKRKFCLCGYNCECDLVFIQEIDEPQRLYDELGAAVARKIAESIAATNAASNRLFCELANINLAYCDYLEKP